MWNTILLKFDSKTSYYNLSPVLREQINTSKYKYELSEYDEIRNNSRKKADINNCSMFDLTKLPGISIVHAKRIINKREEIGGFKNIDAVFSYLNLKPHHIKQLKEMTKVSKIRGYVRKHFSKERRVDI